MKIKSVILLFISGFSLMTGRLFPEQAPDTHPLSGSLNDPLPVFLDMARPNRPSETGTLVTHCGDSGPGSFREAIFRMRAFSWRVWTAEVSPDVISGSISGGMRLQRIIMAFICCT